MMIDFIIKTKAISDPSRVRMLKLLEGGELCVCDIMKILELRQSTASKHLGILKAAGLVETRKDGTWSYYRLPEGSPYPDGGHLAFLAASLDDDVTVRKDRMRLRKTPRGACDRGPAGRRCG